MKRRIIIRVDGSPEIGMGHVVRCLALADMLKDEFSIAFAIQKPADRVSEKIKAVAQEIVLLPETKNYIDDAIEFSQHLMDKDIVVLDGYNFKTDYQRSVKSKCFKLVCIDDLHAWHQVADAVINYSEAVDKSGYSTEDYTKLYTGVNYILLRNEFLKATKNPKQISTVKKVFISMGAADVHNLSLKITTVILDVHEISEVHIMVGSVNQHLKSIEELKSSSRNKNITIHKDISAESLIQVLEECDLAICPASSISLECCAIGIGLISGTTAANQADIQKSLNKFEAAIDFGDLTALNDEKFKAKILQVINQPEQLNQMIQRQLQMIDGKSPERIAAVFKKLAAEKLTFRLATSGDVDLYFDWVNDPLVRINSYQQKPVSFEDHKKWFNTKLASNNCRFYLFFNEENVPVGQVRIEKSESEIVIGITIDKMFRGKSFSVEMLRTASNDFYENYPGSEIVAYIKEDNIASYKSFLKAGYKFDKMINMHGSSSFKLLYKTHSE